MSKAKRHSLYCMNCDWELKGTHKHTDGWKCPKCKVGLIAPGEREDERYAKSNR